MIVEIMQDPVVKYVIDKSKDSDDAKWVQIPKTSNYEEIALIQDSLKDFFKRHDVTITAFQESFIRHNVEYIRFKIIFKKHI